MSAEITEAAQQARERLHEEIERVRLGVEEMIDADGNAVGNGGIAEELAELRLETRDYVKRKVRKSEKRLEKSVRELDARTDGLERKIGEVEADRENAEVRIHNNTEQMLDGLLGEIRSIADRLSKAPVPRPQAPAAKAPAAKPSPDKPPAKHPADGEPTVRRISVPQVPVGRVGRRRPAN